MVRQEVGFKKSSLSPRQYHSHHVGWRVSMVTSPQLLVLLLLLVVFGVMADGREIPIAKESLATLANNNGGVKEQEVDLNGEPKIVQDNLYILNQKNKESSQPISDNSKVQDETETETTQLGESGEVSIPEKRRPMYDDKEEDMGYDEDNYYDGEGDSYDFDMPRWITILIYVLYFLYYSIRVIQWSLLAFGIFGDAIWSTLGIRHPPNFYWTVKQYGVQLIIFFFLIVPPMNFNFPHLLEEMSHGSGGGGGGGYFEF